MLGDHIRALKGEKWLHGIDLGDQRVLHLVEDPGLAPGDRLRRVYKPDFTAGASRVELVVHRERTYPARAVVARAWSRFMDPSVVAMFRDSEQFAAWCKVGRLPEGGSAPAPAAAPAVKQAAPASSAAARPAAKKPAAVKKPAAKKASATKPPAKKAVKKAAKKAARKAAGKAAPTAAKRAGSKPAAKRPAAGKAAGRKPAAKAARPAKKAVGRKAAKPAKKKGRR